MYYTIERIYSLVKLLLTLLSMSIKEKIQTYLNYKGVTPTAAERKLGWGVGAFTKAKSITAERAKEFLLLYDDLSSEWLFRDKGDMILESTPSLTNVYELLLSERDKKIRELEIELSQYKFTETKISSN